MKFMRLGFTHRVHGADSSMPTQGSRSRRWLHRLSDSALHVSLLLAVLVVAALAVLQSLGGGVTVWLLDPVVVHGKAGRR